MDQPAWLAEAWLEFGETERPGADHNPRIVKLYADAGQPGVANDEVAWCAAFLGACLQRSGIAGTKSLMARSYASWGDKLDEPRSGAVAVLSRSSNPALGHVAFVVGDSDDTLFLLGGNQADAVSVAAFPKNRLVALRWPSSTGPATSRPSTPQPPDIFEQTLAHVLVMEGGFSNDENDPGGPTNKGITLAEYAEWKGQPLDATTSPHLLSALQSITDVELRDIYRRRYWDVAGCPQLSPALALMQFDTGVNQGPVTAIRWWARKSTANSDHRPAPRSQPDRLPAS